MRVRGVLVWNGMSSRRFGVSWCGWVCACLRKFVCLLACLLALLPKASGRLSSGGRAFTSRQLRSANLVASLGPKPDNAITASVAPDEGTSTPLQEVFLQLSSSWCKGLRPKLKPYAQHLYP